MEMLMQRVGREIVAAGFACVCSATTLAAAVADDPQAPERTIVFDLADFVPFAAAGEVFGAGSEQGEVVHARMDVTFVSNEAGPWSMSASFVDFPMGGAVGFSSDLEGWSGVGTFDKVIETDAMNGPLLVPKGQAFYAWFLQWSGGAPFELPGGGMGIGPMDGHFETLKLTLTMAPCPFGDPAVPWEDVGFGLAGTNGIPSLSAEGSLCDDEPGTLRMQSGPANGVTILFLGVSRIDAPLEGGTLVPSPDVLIVGVPLDAVGEGELPFNFPASVPSGLEFWMQAWIPDPGGPFGYAATNGVRACVP